MKFYKYYLLTLVVIFVDQLIKLLVYFNMEMHSTGAIPVFGDWFKLHYTLNEGMAFGMTFNHKYGKFILSIFRILAVTGIAFYLRHLILTKAHPMLNWCVALILGGAIGNVVDSTFYGVLLDNAPPTAPTPWFHGQVIDMFYVDICNCYMPDWVPIFGGSYYFIWPIFNFADASIFVGVIMILVSQKWIFKDEDDEYFQKKDEDEDNENIHRTNEDSPGKTT